MRPVECHGHRPVLGVLERPRAVGTEELAPAARFSQVGSRAHAVAHAARRSTPACGSSLHRREHALGRSRGCCRTGEGPLRSSSSTFGARHDGDPLQPAPSEDRTGLGSDAEGRRALESECCQPRFRHPSRCVLCFSRICSNHISFVFSRAPDTRSRESRTRSARLQPTFSGGVDGTSS